MRYAILIPVAALLCGIPATSARANMVVEASVGYGYQTSPEKAAEATSFMVAPGIGLLGDLLKLQLGFVGALSAAEDGNLEEFGLQLRPMLVVSPPILPIYGRITVAAVDLLDSDNRQLAYGASIGLSISLAALGVFAEAGALPRTEDDEFVWVIEGRAGVSLSF